MSGQNPERDQSQGAELRGELSLSTSTRSQESLRQGTLPHVEAQQGGALASQLEVMIDQRPTSLSASPSAQPQQLEQPHVKAAQSFFAETERLMNSFLDKDATSTMHKLSQVQGALQDVVRLKIQQFLALSVQSRGMSASSMRMLIQEGLGELATLYQLTPAQRALLDLLSVSVAMPEELDASSEKEADSEVEPERQTKNEPHLVVTEEEAVEVLLARAKLRAEYKKEIEGADPLMEFIPDIPEPPPVGEARPLEEKVLEAAGVHTISGRVISQKSGDGLQGIVIYGGVLGNVVTDARGEFSFINVAHGTLYSLMASKRSHTFDPPVQGGTLLMSAQHIFTAIREP